MTFFRAHRPSPARRRRAFTLIEIMIVVAIIGLIAAMGLPALEKVLLKEGMRKALSDISDVCASARAKAIMSGQNVAVVFHPQPGEQSFSVEGGGPGHGALYVNTSQLPKDVIFKMLEISKHDYMAQESGKVWFYPNGTCDELIIVLHDNTDWRKLTLEFSTGAMKVSDVDK